MIINPQNMRGIYVAYNTLFNKAFAAAVPLYEKIATIVPSTTESEIYAWLGDIPGMREWVGEREIQNLTGSDYTIKNKKFELTVGVPRDAVEDDKLGLYNTNIQMLGESCAMHPDKLVFGLLKDGFTLKCYDGEPFFSDKHKVGKKAASNISHAPLTLESYIAARTSMLSLTNSKGTALSIVPNLLVVPPALEAKAREILVADIVNGTRNTMAGTAEALMVPELAGNDTAWFLLATQRPIKPLIYQQRRTAKFVSMTDEKDDNVFWNDTFVYGGDSRGNAGYGFWQMAFGSDGTGA